MSSRGSPPKIKSWCLSAYLQSIQDVGDFVSSVEDKRKCLTQNCYSLAVDVDASRTDCCERAQDSWTLRWIRGKNDINTVQFLAQSDRFVS